jgi:hypothetical protein
MEQLGLGYEIETKINGKVVAIKPYSENASKKGAQLQFAKIGEKGLVTIDVKIEAAREDDLKKYVNQNVVIKGVQITKVDFNTYYSTADKSLISVQNSSKGA